MVADAAASKKNRMGPLLGFFIPHFGNYHEIIWSGITQVTEQYDAKVLCFVGGELNSPLGFQKHWNVIYDLASSTNLDGLIVLSAPLQNYITVEEMTQFCTRYAPLPMVSIGLELKGIPSITIDNFAGMRELMKHLFEHHQYRRIAFIRGPERNQEAEARYRAYAESLEGYGIPFDPNLVAPGDFFVDAGVEAIKLFLDQRKVSFDVVVASNDNMAIGAWQELTRRGINVPADVAITGFDDVPEARTFATPLTTMRQPLAEQGRQAVRMLLEYLHHGTPPENLALGAEPVIRESCGCISWAASSLPSPTVIVPTGTAENTLANQRDVIIADIQKVICPYFSEITLQSTESLVDAFFDVLQGKPASQFLSLFSRLLQTGTMNLSQIEFEEGIMVRWQEALSILRRKALPYKQPDVTTDMDGLLHRGCILITEAAERVHSNLRGRAEANMRTRSEVVRGLNAALDIQRVADVLAQNLPKLSIHTCSLALYEGNPVPPPLSRLIMAYHDGKRIELEPDGRLFPTVQLIPPDLLPDSKLPYLMIRPLVSRDTHFGFIVMEVISGYRTMYYDTYDEELSEQISSALHRALLLEQIARSNESLQLRAAELVEANTQLEQFAYVASHDLQEPLRMVASYLQLLEKRYQDKLDTDAQEFIAYAVDGAARMKRMINDLLAYSRVTTRGQQPLPTDCGYLLAQVLSNLEIAIKENDALVTNDPLPIVMADSTQLMAVFQNLIGNAIKFHADRRPHVHISAAKREQEWLFSVCDNGIGIAPEYTERIFTIFSRLHPQSTYPGTGIGLAICRKVVERHGGHIWVESQPGEGATFFFTIPAQT